MAVVMVAAMVAAMAVVRVEATVAALVVATAAALVAVMVDHRETITARRSPRDDHRETRRSRGDGVGVVQSRTLSDGPGETGETGEIGAASTLESSLVVAHNALDRTPQP